MLEAFGDIWETWSSSQLISYPKITKRYDSIVITTNGFVKKDGSLVMGRGIAKEARDRIPGIDKRIGRAVQRDGNHVYAFHNGPLEPIIFSFPVKPEKGLLYGRLMPGWMVKADIALIEQSAKELVALIEGLHYNQFTINAWPFKNILMPRPGCGNGGLKWEEVKPIIEPILDDRFTVMHNPAIV